MAFVNEPHPPTTNAIPPPHRAEGHRRGRVGYSLQQQQSLLPARRLLVAVQHLGPQILVMLNGKLASLARTG
jgi:hypothetical protein